MFLKVIEYLEQSIRKYLKCIAKDHQIRTNKQSTNQSTRIEIWKYKTDGNTKYNQVKLVFAVFAFDSLYQVSIKLY